MAVLKNQSLMFETLVGLADKFDEMIDSL